LTDVSEKLTAFPSVSTILHCATPQKAIFTCTALKFKGADKYLVCEFSGSHGSEYKDDRLLEYGAV
jgi:hypothetical protein